jgi:hypothetical protein
MNTILAAEGFDVEDIDLLKETIIYYKNFWQALWDFVLKYCLLWVYRIYIIFSTIEIYYCPTMNL